MNSNVRAVMFWTVIVVSAFLLWQVTRSDRNGVRATEISYSEFLSQVEAGSVSKVIISKTRVDGQYRDGRSFRVTAPSAQEGMLKLLQEKNAEIWLKDTPESGQAWLLNLAPLVLLGALWLFMIRQMRQRQSRPTGTDFPK